MNALHECLRRLAHGPLGTVVHLGAGSGAILPVYTGVDAQQVLLLEGDPRAAASLRQGCAERPRMQVLCEVLRPHAGPVTWRCYNLPALNGPLSALGLRSIYPRLLETEQAERAGRPIADWMAGVDLSTDPQRPNLLVLDMPGQETGLVDALPPSLLQGFQQIVVRGCASPPDAQWNSTSSVCDLLEARHFRRDTALKPPADDPLWPVEVFTFDPGAQRAAQLELRLTQHDREREEAQRRLRDEAARADEAQARLLAARTECEALQSALASRQAELEAQAAQAEAAAREWSRHTDQLQSERDALGSRLEEALAQARIAEADKLDLTQRLAQAQRECVELGERLARHEQARESSQAESETLRAERDQARLEHAQAHERIDTLQAERALLQAQLEELRLSTEAAEAAWVARIDDLGRDRSAIDASLHRAAARIAELENIVRTQSGAIEELALQEKQRQALLEEAAQLRSAHEASEAALRQESDRLAGDLQRSEGRCAELLARITHMETEGAQRESAASAQASDLRRDLEAAQASLHALRAERDHEAHWHAENKKWALALKDEKESLERALAEVRNQIQVLREQLAQADAQRAARQQELEAALEEARRQADQLRQDRTQAEQSWQDQMIRLREERNHEAHWHAEHKKWAGSLKQERDALDERLQALTRELESHQARIADAKATEQTLRAELADRDARQRLLDAEVLRAEAQLDLIKDVLIREKNF